MGMTMSEMQSGDSRRELGNVSDLFISSSEEEKAPAKRLFENRSGQAEDEGEVEESVTLQKKIAYPNTRNAQESIWRCLSNYVREEYMIHHIELRKTSDILEPGVKKRREEEITIILKETS
jgi:hypothetical protein